MWVEEVKRMPSSIRDRHSDFICCNLTFRYCCHVIPSVTTLLHSLALQSQPTITQSICCLSLFLKYIKGGSFA